MHLFEAFDLGLFRFVNQTLGNPVFDAVMPFASGNALFFPVVLALVVLLAWKGGVRGRLCLLMLALIIGPGDGLVCNTIKHAVARPRPFVVLPDVRLPAGGSGGMASAPAPEKPGNGAAPVARKYGYNSMPSSHAANWFAATMIFLVYYRRSWRFMLPLACVVSFSRVYNGVHYPSDVLAGAILGAGYAVAGMWAVTALWQWSGRRWFPLWWRQLPHLHNPQLKLPAPESATPNPQPATRNLVQPSTDQHWLRLGYAFIGLLLLVNLVYIGSGTIQLSEDEAYQWVWSKHPALSYFSKPPLIAYTQLLGTTLWGDNEFGVRFFSPVISATLGVLLLRFFAREINARAGVFLLLMVAMTPLMAVGSVLMTVDPLSVLFWTAAMFAGWRAVQPGAGTAPWLWTGLWMGLGFLSKYTELFQWLCWVVFFILWKPARVHLRRAGPYLALCINLLCMLPVLIWNQQHHWITVAHVADNAGVGTPWQPSPKHLFEFLGQECFLLNPVFFIAAIWAAVAFWKRKPQDLRLVFLFSMGAPLFLCYLLHTLRSRVLPNWIAPSVLPLFCMAVVYWDIRRREGQRSVARWLAAGFALGLPLVVLLHDTDLIQKVVGKPLPAERNPMVRVRGHRSLAEIADTARQNLAREGPPVFIIGDHYGTTGLVSFYLPEARTNVARAPLVYYLSSKQPANQFYFWPGYQDQRKGQNAIFVRQLSAPRLVRGWLGKWLAGEVNLRREKPRRDPPPASLTKEFDSVTDLGLYNTLYRGRVCYTVQLFECRNLR